MTVMPAIVVSVLVDAPLRRLWDALSDLESHPDWMADATAVDFATDRRAGVGTVMRVATRIGPLRLADDLEVTVWDENRTIAVDHRGRVRGTGRFELAPLAGCIRLTWREDLRFPWWLGGPATGLLARPVLILVWRRNLRRFKKMVEGPLRASANRAHPR